MLHISHRLFQRYGDPKLTNPGTPERAFAELWKQHCSSQFLEAHLSLLATMSQVGPVSFVVQHCYCSHSSRSGPRSSSAPCNSLEPYLARWPASLRWHPSLL